MRRILALLILLAIPAVAQFGGPMGGMPPSAMQGGGLLPGRGGDPLWVAAGPTKPTLDFDFAGRKDLTDAVSSDTSLITFSRSAAQSPGTYVGADGLIHDAPVNLALYSEQFDNASWVQGGVTTAANQIASPDGKQTADFAEESGGLRQHYTYRSISVVSGSVYTFSVYAKQGGTRYVSLYPQGSSGTAIALFDLQDGAVLTTSGAQYQSSSIENTGDGWFRLSVTFNSIGTSGLAVVYLSNSSTAAAPSYSSTAGNGVFLWGAQLQETDPATMQPTAYIHTTSQALAAPRFDHDPDFPYVENLLLYSEAFDESAGWVSSGISFSNSETDPFGGSSAYRVTGTGRLNTAYTIPATGTYTFSMWVKTASGSSETYKGLVYPGSGSTFSTTINGDWQRISFTVDVSTIGAPYFYAFDSRFGGATDIYIFGAQLEKASSVGEYVPTTDQTRKSQGNVTTNLQIYSEMFSKFTALSGPVIVDNADTAPDGTVTADTIQDPGASYSGIQGALTGSSGQTITTSIYLKKISTTPTFYPALQIARGDGSTLTTIFMNLQTGATTPLVGGARVTPDDHGAEDAGDYWRFYSTTVSQGSTMSYNFYPAFSSNGTSASATATGTVTAWGAQSEFAPSPQTYVRTLSETRSISDANAESLGLLVEEQRANLIPYGESFDNAAWTKRGACTVTANAVVAPDGTQTADRITGLGGGSDDMYESVVGTASTSHTPSVYMKRVSTSGVLFLANSYGLALGEWNIDLSQLPDEWVRITPTTPGVTVITDYVTSASGGGGMHFRAISGGPLSFDLWGAQLEQGAFPTSYIPTTSSAQTRYADVAAVQDEDFATTNLLSYSESFDVGWTLTGVTIAANDETAPDGTTSADKLTANTTSYRRIDQSVTTVSGVDYTLSVYAKAGNQNFVALEFRGSGSTPDAVFDLSTGTVSSGNGSIESVGNGWYRCSITEAATGTTSSAIISRGSSGSVGDTVYLWGASLTATEYPVEYVTTRNLLTDSQDFERSSWTKYKIGTGVAPAIASGTEQAPDGTNTASEITFSAPASGDQSFMTHSFPSISGVQYVGSFYVKGEGANVGKKLLFRHAATSGFQTVTLTGDWQRVTRQETSGVTGTRTVDIGLRPGINGTPTDTVTAILWGAQLEPGTTATDYVRTVDTVGKAYGFYEPTEGTVFVEGAVVDTGNPGFIGWGSGTGSIIRGGTAVAAWWSGTASVATTNTATWSDGVKIGASYKAALRKLTLDGGTVASSATENPIGDKIRIGQNYSGTGNVANGHIKRLTYWPRRQSDSTLQVITQ